MSAEEVPRPAWFEKRVVPYKIGICMASVCAVIDAAPKEVERELNASYPTGISSRWEISSEAFATGEANPTPCNHYPTERRHWLLEC